mgnify:CR=1 FL=1
MWNYSLYLYSSGYKRHYQGAPDQDRSDSSLPDHTSPKELKMYNSVDRAVSRSGFDGYVLKHDRLHGEIFAAICVNTDAMPCSFEKCTHFQAISSDFPDSSQARYELAGFIAGYLTLWEKVSCLDVSKRIVEVRKVSCD